MLRNKHVKWAGVYTSTAVLLKGIVFCQTIWVAHRLSVSDFGSWGLLYALQTGVATFAGVGIYEGITSLLATKKMDRDQCYSFVLKPFLLSAVIVVTVSFVGARFLGIFKFDFFYLMCTILSGVLLSFSLLASQVTRLNDNNRDALLLSFLMPCASALGSSIAFLWFATSEAFFVGSFLGLLCGFIAINLLNVRIFFGSKQFLQNKDFCWQLVKRTPPFFVVAIFGWLSGYGNTFIISDFFNQSDVARYTFAMSVAAMLQLVASAINQVWTPRFLQLYITISFEDVARKSKQIALLQGLVLGGVAMLSLLILPGIFSFFGGSLAQYSEMKTEFFYLFSGYIFLIQWWRCQNFILAKDHGVKYMNLTLATGFSGIITWILFMANFGAIGIYLGFMVQMLFRSIGISFVCYKSIGLKPDLIAPAVGVFIASIGLL